MHTTFRDKVGLDKLGLDKLGLEKLGLDKLANETLGKLGLDRLSKDDLHETIVASTPLLAVFGAGDLAVERLRSARADLAARSASFDASAFREQVQATVVDRIEALQTGLMATPEQIMELPERAQEWPTRAQSMLADLVSAAFSTYGELAGRGMTVVSQSRLFGDDAADDGLEDEAPPVTRPSTPVVQPVIQPVVGAESTLTGAGFASATGLVDDVPGSMPSVDELLQTTHSTQATQTTQSTVGEEPASPAPSAAPAKPRRKAATAAKTTNAKTTTAKTATAKIAAASPPAAAKPRPPKSAAKKSAPAQPTASAQLIAGVTDAPDDGPADTLA